MRRAIGDLEQFADDRLFEVLSEGLPLIVDNAASHDNSARHLHKAGEPRASEAMRGFAEEEAAKFLILVDYVRCPPIPERRSQVLKRFYSHVAKRIHAQACAYPRIRFFGELCEFVESECRPWYLDGPNDVDWIFPNAVVAEREQELYVDYVQDVTDTAGDRFWTTPPDPAPIVSRYATPDSVTLVQSLFRAGASSPEGLAEIAGIWRGFEPELDTDRGQLRSLIASTLERLAHCGHAVDETTAQIVTWHWPFPMWALTIPEPSRAPDNREDLREERRRRIEWMEETEAKRDPPPTISRSKVERLNDAYAAWRRDTDAVATDRTEDEDTHPRIRYLPASGKEFELPSYAHLEGMFRQLTAKERAALLALGDYARERVADWPRIHARAVREEPTTDEGYQISCACYWLDGLNRWEEPAQEFQPGRWRRLP